MIIIGIHAEHARSGKDTVADFLGAHRRARGGGVLVKLAFADPIKRVVRDVYDFSDEQLWGDKKDKGDPRYMRSDGTLLTPREAMQRLGTEWGRGCYSNTWVDYAMRTVQKLRKGGYLYEGPTGIYRSSVSANFLTIPDVRFNNEVEAIHRAGGFIVHVVRDSGGLQGEAGLHLSETQGVCPEFIDFVVDNNGSLEELEQRVQVLLKEVEQRCG